MDDWVLWLLPFFNGWCRGQYLNRVAGMRGHPDACWRVAMDMATERAMACYGFGWWEDARWVWPDSPRVPL